MILLIDDHNDKSHQQMLANYLLGLCVTPNTAQRNQSQGSGLWHYTSSALI
jgi:hypothetical protein